MDNTNNQQQSLFNEPNNTSLGTNPEVTKDTPPLISEEDLAAVKTDPESPEVEIMSNGQKYEASNESEEQEENESEEQKAESEKQEEDVTPTEAKNYKEAGKQIDEITKSVSAKGVDVNKLFEEYENSGELSQQSYDALMKAGYPQALVDALISGWEATANQYTESVYKAVGGEQEYKAITEFVKSQGDKEIDAFNEVVNNSSYNVVTKYLNAIKAEMTAKHGTSNPVLSGKGSNSEPGGFASEADMMKAMSDPRYSTDANYTKAVERKIAMSNFFD